MRLATTHINGTDMTHTEVVKSLRKVCVQIPHSLEGRRVSSTQQASTSTSGPGTSTLYKLSQTDHTEQSKVVVCRILKNDHANRNTA